MERALHQGTDKGYYLMVLQDRFKDRCERNPRYSLRAYAKDLQTNAGQLSRVLSGRLALSLKRAEVIADQLTMLPDERHLFLGSVVASRLNKRSGGTTARSMGPSFVEPPENDQMDSDTFVAISNLQHFAILELTYLDDFKSDVRWIAKQLGITVIEVQQALARLEALGLIQKKGGKIVKTRKKLSAVYKKVGAVAFRNMHRSSLRCALSALNKYPAERRHNHSVTLAINPDQLNVAREMLIESVGAVIKALEIGQQKEIYQFTIALNPLDLKG